MLFIINEKGKIIEQDLEPVYQSSNKATNISILAPFTDKVVTIAFELPNGNKSRTYLLTRGVAINKGKYLGYSIYGTNLPKQITSYAGQVRAQFCIYQGTAEIVGDELNIDGQIITTATAIFTVTDGVLAVNTDIEEETADTLIDDVLHALGVLEANETARQEGFANAMREADNVVNSIKSGDYIVIDGGDANVFVQEEEEPTQVQGARLEFNSIYEFPNMGEQGKIYVDTSTGISYFWQATENMYLIIQE